MDQLVRKVLVLLTIIMLLPTAVGVFGGILGPELRRLMHGVEATNQETVSKLFVTAGLVLFVVGLGARFARSVRHDPKRDAVERRSRMTARHVANEVPVHDIGRRHRTDDDPSLPL